MPLTIDESWAEVEKTLQKPQVLSISDSGDIMMTLTWEDWKQEISTLWNFLRLTDIEQNEVSLMSQTWYTLVWDRMIWLDYPEYFKDFHDTNSKLFISWKEIYITRDQFKNDTSQEVFPDREKRELIFVKLNLPKLIAPEVQQEVLNSKGWIQRILADMWFWK